MALREPLIVLVLLFLGACPAVAEDLGEVHIAVAAPLVTLDPVRFQNDAERFVVANVYETLYTYDHLARPYRLRPQLAAALPEVSEDGRTLTIRLRTDARFADDACFEGGKGRPLGADDVVYSLRRLMDRRLGSWGTWVVGDRIVGLEAFAEASTDVPADRRSTRYGPEDGFQEATGLVALDAHTVRLRLTRPAPELPWLLAGAAASIHPPEAVAHHGEAFARHPVSTGPYTLLAFTGERRVVLVRRQDARACLYPTEGLPEDADTGMLADAGRPLPRNTGAVIEHVADANLAWERLQAGDFDVGPLARDAAYTALVPGHGTLAAPLAAKGLRLERTPLLEIRYQVFQMEDPVLGRPAGEQGTALRRVLSLLGDDTWSIERLWAGMAERVHGLVLPETHEHDRAFRSHWQRAPGETLEEALEAARELLAEIGHPGGEGLPVLKALVRDDPTSRLAFEQDQARTAAAGLRVEPEFVDAATLRRRLDEGAFQIADTSWQADHPDVLDFLQLVYGASGPHINTSRFADERVDALYETVRRLPQGEARRTAARTLQELVMEAAPVRLRYRRVRHDVVQPWLRGYRSHAIEPRWLPYVAVDVAARRAAVGR